MRKLIVLAIMVFGLFTTKVQAQKYGHLNLGNVVQLMPQTVEADTMLKVFQTDLVKKGQEMAMAFQQNAAAFIDSVNKGIIPPLQQQQRQAQLEQERQTILAYEQEVARQVQQKQAELLDPIIKIVEDAINAIAKEQGYTMIFDSSVFNTLLFAQPTDDLFPIMKERLGLKDPEK